MDIANFNLIRPTGLPEEARVVRLWDSRELRSPDAAEGTDAPTIGLEALPDTLFGAKEDQVFATPARVTNASALQRLFWFLNSISTTLATKRDLISGRRLDALCEKAQEKFAVDFGVWHQALGIAVDRAVVAQIALLALRKKLVTDFLLEPPALDRAAQHTRIVLVAALLDRRRRALRAFTAAQVQHFLAGSTVVLAGMAASAMTPNSRVDLVRDARVADLNIVRREWSRYLPGEIANIRNVMAGESFKLSDKTLSETENTTTDDSEKSTQSESESQSKLSTELSQEVNSQLAISVNGYADVSAQFKYPMVTTTISGGVNAGVTLQRAEQHASRIAREAVSRAVSRVDSRTRQSRVRRELLRSEVAHEYALINSSTKHSHGIYRWVDRIDRYQVFRYPSRLLLEFQIPEPAEYFRFRTNKSRTAAAGHERPPEWNVVASNISSENFTTFGTLFRASNLPAPPNAKVSVVRSLTVELGAESLPLDDIKSVFNLPSTVKELEIPIPEGYLAVTVRYSGEGAPISGKFGNSVGKHTSVALISVGASTRAYFAAGYLKEAGTGKTLYFASHGDFPDLGAAMDTQYNGPALEYGRAFLRIGSSGTFDPAPETIDLTTLPNSTTTLPGATGLLKVAVNVTGCSACSVTFHVVCMRSAETYINWQLSVYDALFSAWSQWKREYENALARQAMVGSAAADAGSSQRNEQIIREELKRSTIAWLLGEPHFAGRNGLNPRPSSAGVETDFADISVNNAMTDAVTIQFLEQAFEWSNLSYVFYSYFWAGRDGWNELTATSANDPEFERFLRAGSARVILPARPGFDEAVRNWLAHGVPFIDGHLPAPDDPLYVSIDREIRDLTAPVPGGVACDTWTSKVGTTMLYLDDNAVLPFGNDNALLPKPLGSVT